MSISENKEFQKKKKEKKKKESKVGEQVLVRRKIIENIEKVKASWA